ncbi:hypothetical protein MUP77_01355 [Candidatus Bathyarchaeota archaeon]|nr:hypothetical protein [Candidatus Bathyarchaeota archaeon]
MSNRIQSAVNLAVRDSVFEERQNVFDSFKYALSQICDLNTRAVVAQEFWNALNRRGIVFNEEVEELVSDSLS